MLVLEGVEGLPRIGELKLLRHQRLGQTWVTMMLNGLSWKRNQDHAVVFETACRYSTLDFFVNYEGDSISSNGFLPKIIDIVVI